MSKVAIIGSKGYIGRHLVWYLKEHKGIIAEEYDIVDSHEEYYHKVNMLEKEAVAGINLNVDYIFMMTGLTGTKAGFDSYERFVDINEIGLLNLLDAIRKSPYRPKVVFPSTRLVYKGVDKALKEEDEKDTKTIYAANKIACEGYLKAYSYNFDISFTVFRICVPYGNMLDDNYSFGTVGFFIKMASEGKDITMYGGGTNKRTFTHLYDICYQMVEGAMNPASDNQIYNVGGETHSLHDAAEIFAEKYGVNVVAVPWPEADLRLESGHTYFDDSRIQSLLGELKYKKLKDLL
ncbi:UDP-glucose 4-epimerase [Bacteroides faecichinchillae]|uniref:UDP-glucose 4-epimerase n=1 Tax=Bacteroides faecichinchillae TaxID=871325 RepID=A0A1M5FW64_9BACE|nr:NAD(P)-dependent oxidoreductase [Bacteroides faecichinchillae]THG59868.1 NAD(P)-dependent oxidoreductase [Bacteroides faecichinchillae]SHF95441.1 UDP-glucose 4-epimerase [Bacteroides faecichinchillae]